MNQFALRMFVRSILAEAKDKKAKEEPKKETKKPTEKKAKKTSGNLVEMKQELTALKDQLKDIEDLIAAFSNITPSSYSTDIEIIGDAIEDAQKQVEKLKKEKESIEKEIATLKENTLSEMNRIKEMMGLVAPKKKGAKKMVDEKKEELDEARFKKGEDVGKPGKGFAKIAKSAAERYGSEEAGKKVAGAILKKVVKK